MKTDFPYPYYIYGSSDSTDTDVVIVIPKNEMPAAQEQRKNFVLDLKNTYEFDWNATLAVIENGVMIDTIYTKSWIDSLNNALLKTYCHHSQVYPLLINHKIKRNKVLAIYKAVRTVLTMLTRTSYRSEIRPILKGIHDFNLKVEVLKKIDFENIETFNQKNTSDADVWKIIAFYVGQNNALIKEDEEIYTKADLIVKFPEMFPFVYRQNISIADKRVLQRFISEWIALIQNFGVFKSENGFLYCNDEYADMLNEKY
ncbi:hypothetical protein BWK58_07505 [Flavobacterium columnare]|nr:hypothetical protein BWK58_07505 [Flavobacterium columnare]